MIQKKKIQLTFVVMILVLGGIILGGIFPLIKKIKKQSKDLFFQKRILEETLKKIESWEEFKKNYPLYRKNLEKINQGFVNPEEPIDFLEFLEKEGASHNLKLEISPVSFQEKTKGFLETVGFRISSTGDYQQCLKFLEKLETSRYLIEFVQLEMEQITPHTLKKIKKGKIGDIFFEVILKTFSPKHNL